MLTKKRKMFSRKMMALLMTLTLVTGMMPVTALSATSDGVIYDVQYSGDDYYIPDNGIMQDQYGNTAYEDLTDYGDATEHGDITDDYGDTTDYDDITGDDRYDDTTDYDDITGDYDNGSYDDDTDYDDIDDYDENDYNDEHVHSYSVIREEDASCETSGKRTLKCDTCGDEKTETTPATGHVFGTPVVEYAPTSTEYGKNSVSCIYCGYTEEYYTDPYGEYSEEETEETSYRESEKEPLTAVLPESVFSSSDPEKDALSAPDFVASILLSAAAWKEGLLTEYPQDDRLVIDKIITSSPNNADYGYAMDETIIYEITVQNKSEETVEYIVFDPLISDCECLGGGTLEANEQQTISFSYSVTTEDALKGYIENTAYAKTTDEKIAFSNTIVARTYPYSDYHSVTFTKTIVNVPETGYFEYGDTATCILTVVNDSDEDVWVQEIRDITFDTTVVDSFFVESHDTYSVIFEHIIDQTDVNNELFYNLASCEYAINGDHCIAYSDAEANVHGEKQFLTIEQTVASTPANSFYYTKDETVLFQFTIHNPTDKAFTNLSVWGKDFEYWMNGFGSIAPDETITFVYPVTVTSDQVEDGSIYSVGILEALNYQDCIGHVVSNDVIVPTGKEEGQVTIFKEVTNTPPDGYMFGLGDMIYYRITVYNGTDETLYDAVIDDILFADPTVGTFSEIQPGETVSCDFNLDVTAYDVSQGEVYNIGSVTYRKGRDESRIHLDSNETRTPVKTNDNSLIVLKKEVSKPKNNKFYTLSEQIDYEITVINSGDNTYDDVIVYDSLVPGYGEIGSTGEFMPGDKKTFSYPHVVTQPDVDNRKVYNFAAAAGMIDGYFVSVAESDPVISPTNEYIPEWKSYTPVPQLPPVEPENDSYCRRTLSPLGEEHVTYTIENCSVHADTDQMVMDMVAAASNEDELLNAWTSAADLWEADIQDMFDELLFSETDSTMRLVLINLNNGFSGQMVSYKKVLDLILKDDPVKAAQLKAEELKRFCTDLCAIIHDPESITAKTDKEVQEDIDTTLCVMGSEHKKAGLEYVNYGFCDSHKTNGKNVVQLLTGTAPKKLTWAKCDRNWKIAYAGITKAAANTVSSDDKNAILTDATIYANYVELWKVFVTSVLNDYEESVYSEVTARAYMDRTTTLAEILENK